MKKISILLIALMVISVGFLSGCTDELGDTSESDGQKFIGKWSVYGSQEMITFNPDGTGISETTSSSFVVNINWWIDNGYIYMSSGTTGKCRYHFVNNDRVELTFEDSGQKQIMNRMD
jgi:hypothetical protein